MLCFSLQAAIFVIGSSLSCVLVDVRIVCVEGWGLVIFHWFIMSMRMQIILDSPDLVPRASFPLTSGRKTRALGVSVFE